MDKKSLLFVMASLMVLSASAQLKQASVHVQKAIKQLDYRQKPPALMQEMHAASANPSFVTNAPRKTDGDVDVYWIRPAGVFPGIILMENGANAGQYYMPLYLVKPYADHAFWGVAENAVDDVIFSWYYEKYIRNDDGEWEHVGLTYEGNPLVVNYVWGDEEEVPKLNAETDYGDMYYWQSGGYEMSGDSGHPVVGDFHVSYIESTPNCFELYDEEDVELLVSSKTFTPGGRHGDQYYSMTYYSGCVPFSGNEKGWWFGKNGGRTNGMPVDGIAQAFEKPAHPYLLKQVVIYSGLLAVTGPVEMTCHVYKLPHGLPAYDSENPVCLNEDDFGEEIAFGRASLTPETNDVTGGLIIFTLYGEEDGMEYEITPTIEDAIIICIDGYNDEGMENLKDFTACISPDILSDEGYGEMAYIKYGIPDEEGNFSGNYVWTGLNNFFSTGTMMTGLSIFITVENPFLTYYYGFEDGEYTFPNEGGPMGRIHIPEWDISGIDFLSYEPSADEGWTLTCNGDDVPPEWLSIELTDGEENGEFDYTVHAEVIADPLPEGVTYREAVVRFGFPGAFIDYKFMQGEKIFPLPCGPGVDGEINIGDINHLIWLIFNDMYDNCYDVNDDGEINIADINVLINIILYR